MYKKPDWLAAIFEKGTDAFRHIPFFEISFLSNATNFLFEAKGELLIRENLVEVRLMVEEIFKEILDSEDGDYIIQAQVLALMKPSGW